MFIFARCLRSSAAVTPAKYELDIIKVTIVFIIPKNWENNGTEKIGLVTPTPGSTARCHICVKWLEQRGYHSLCVCQPLDGDFGLKHD